MRKLGDIARDHALTASLRAPQLTAAVQRAAPPLPPSAAVHPVPAGDAGGAAVGAVTGGGGLSKPANGSLQNMHSALGSSGCMPDC